MLGVAMKSKIFCMFAILLLSLSAPLSWAEAPLVPPINTINGGQNYGQWAADWWQWALGVPEANNPMLDLTGENCQQRQTGDVWFLAGLFGSPQAVVRNCDIPYGKALFFPLINNSYGAFLNEPPEWRTDEFMRQAASCPEPVTSLMLFIDGFAIPRLDMFYTGDGGSQSPITSVQLPPDSLFQVLFGLTDDEMETLVPELVLSPFAEEGYYIFLRPLSPGQHTIQFYAEGCFEGFFQDVTYNLTVTME